MLFRIIILTWLAGVPAMLFAQNKNLRNAELAYWSNAFKPAMLLAEKALEQEPGNESALRILLWSGMQLLDDTDPLFKAHEAEISSAQSNEIRFTELFHHLKQGRYKEAEEGAAHFDSTDNGYFYRAALNCYRAFLQKNPEELIKNAREFLLLDKYGMHFDFFGWILEQWISQNNRETLLNQPILREGDPIYTFLHGIFMEDFKTGSRIVIDAAVRTYQEQDVPWVPALSRHALYFALRTRDKNFLSKYGMNAVITDLGHPVSLISAMALSALSDRHFDENMDWEGLGIFEKGYQFTRRTWTPGLFDYFDSCEIAWILGYHQMLGNEVTWSETEPFTALYFIPKSCNANTELHEGLMHMALVRMLISASHRTSTKATEPFEHWSRAVAYKHYIKTTDQKKLIKRIPKTYRELHEDILKRNLAVDAHDFTSGMMRSVVCKWIGEGYPMAVLGLAEAALPVLEKAPEEKGTEWLRNIKRDLEGLMALHTGPDYIFSLTERSYLEELIKKTSDSESRNAYEMLMSYY